MAQPSMAAVAGLKETYVQLKTRMEKAVEDFRKAMASTRTGRANVHMLDTVNVDYYGTMTPLSQLSTVHAEAQMITVQAWDASQLVPIEKAIRSADLGLNPMNDGKLIRVPVPPLTEVALASTPMPATVRKFFIAVKPRPRSRERREAS